MNLYYHIIFFITLFLFFNRSLCDLQIACSITSQCRFEFNQSFSPNKGTGWPPYGTTGCLATEVVKWLHVQNQTRSWSHTHVLHVLRLVGRGIPAVVEDEDVGFGQPLVHFMEEVLFLKGRRGQASTRGQWKWTALIEHLYPKRFTTLPNIA